MLFSLSLSLSLFLSLYYVKCINSKIFFFFPQIFNKLKVLNLSNSKYLTKSPDFSQVPQLEILILEGCISLVQVHESIGNLERLVSLNLEGCKNLRNLPRSISNLKSLETFNLSGCLKVDKLPEELGNMMALTKLLADGTAIKQLPSSFGLLKNLKTLLLFGFKEQSAKSWLSLFSSWMSQKSLNPVSLLPASISGLLLILGVYLHSGIWIYQEIISITYLIASVTFLNCTFCGWVSVRLFNQFLDSLQV